MSETPNDIAIEDDLLVLTNGDVMVKRKGEYRRMIIQQLQVCQGGVGGSNVRGLRLRYP